MGDRRMAGIRTTGGTLYVYTHWEGSSFADMARDAIKVAQPRWDDESYAMRIIVDQLTKGGRDEELGYGLTLRADGAEDSYGGAPSITIDLVGKRLLVAGSRTTPFSQIVGV